jgi:hypothetical protein
MTSSCFCCHHAARTRPRWPPGPSSQANLSLHSSEALQGIDLSTRSSPAPTQIKPQLAPAILGQESVHTMLSTTHHSQERPSTGPRTLQSSASRSIRRKRSPRAIATTTTSSAARRGRPTSPPTKMGTSQAQMSTGVVYLVALPSLRRRRR